MKKITLATLLLVCFSLMGFSQVIDTSGVRKENNKPKATYQVGKAKVTVWEKKINGKNGEFTVKNFEVEKIYKKGEKWETTNNFSETELLQLKAAIDKAISEEGVKESAEEQK